jgi:hypothetical protein
MLHDKKIGVENNPFTKLCRLRISNNPAMLRANALKGGSDGAKTGIKIFYKQDTPTE